jgi:DNA primase
LDVTQDAIAKSNEAILMEGEIDVISSFQSGVANVVAIKGAALTEGHVHLLKRYTERLIFALDSDVAGDAAARRGIDIAEREGMDMKVAVMPMGKDPDEAAREDPVGLKKAMKNAVPIYDYFISSAKKRFDTTAAFGKKKASEELLPMLAKIENSIVQGHYIKRVAAELGVSEDTVIDGMKKVKPVLESLRAADTQEAKKESFAVSGPERLELYCLGLLLQGDTNALSAAFFSAVVPADLKHMGVRRIAEQLQNYGQPEGSFSVVEFAKTLPKELLPVLDEAYLWDLAVHPDNADLFQKEWHKTLKEVQKAILKRKMRDVTDRMKTANAEDETNIQEALARLTTEFTLLEKNS